MRILIVISAALLVYFLLCAYIPSSEKEIIDDRFTKYFKNTSYTDIEDDIIKERFEKAQRMKKQNKKIISSELAQKILSSGIKLTPAEFLYGWLGLVLIPLIILLLARASLFTIFAFLLLGIFIPPLLIERAIAKRKELFTKQLGEALLIISNAIKGGFSFIQAIETIANDMLPPISTEFARTLREIHYGVPQNIALESMSKRVKNQDLDLLISAVITSSQVGGNLSEILDTIADTIKDRIRIKQEVKVLTASGRFSSVIIGGLPLFLLLMLMIINPSYVSLFFETLLGKILLIVSLILEAIGFMIIRKITDIQY